MTTKIDLTKKENPRKMPAPEVKCITFSELFKIKQDGLEALIEDYGAIYLLSKKMTPIKLTRATLS